MKKLVPILAAACGLAAAQPAWQEMYDTPEGKMYFLGTETVGKIARVWGVLDKPRRDTDGSMSEQILYELDCREALVRATVHTYVGPRTTGRVLTQSQGGWGPIAPDTIVSALRQRNCR